MKKCFLLVCLASILVFAGCGTRQKTEDKPAAVLLEEGLHELENGNRIEAIEIFTKIKDWYPFSKHAVTAELKTADAHYETQAYDEAIFAYDNFINLHPRNDAVPYAIYQIGRCYLDQLGHIDQDQTHARKAHDTFKRLLKQYPYSAYTELAEAAIKECRKSIVGHELYVAKFYLKTKKYKAALKRFNDILALFPDVGLQHEALGYIAACEAAIARQEAPASN